MCTKLPDIDLDCSGVTQKSICNTLKNTPASIIKDGEITQHIVGHYFHEVPIDKISGLCSIDYERAQEYGLLKIDVLHNSIYDDIEKRSYIKKLLQYEPDWNLLSNKSVVEQLPHIHNYYQLLQKWKPHNVEQLAMFIAVVRPAKKYLSEIYDFDKIKDIIWVKEDEEYMFKKSHSIGYAMAIKLRLIIETIKRGLIKNNG